MQPAPRQPLLDAYWRVAAERQQVFFARLARRPPPWTEDPILAEYRFCNAYRASDRVSQYLIRNVIYDGGCYTAEDQLLRIVLFRLFSRPSTWELLRAENGEITAADFSVTRYARTLDRAFARGEKLYTPAFILCATRAFGEERKHRNHLALLEQMIRPGALPAAVAAVRSLRQLCEVLREFPLIGPFMAYQLAIDINYSELCEFSENESTIAGPGARRGIAKCFRDAAGWSDERIILWMTERQEEELARLRLPWRDLFGRPLHAIDCQNLFCELDKYARARFPRLRSERTRIKRRFTPSPEPLRLFYPPKWRINGRLSVAPVHEMPVSM